ncbi:MAG: histidinol-phosphate transaminase [Flavobacteriaceae bacterium]|nr:histidinol-phosphate transaminase [Flavobacteriaceae bacterium]
MKRPISKLIRPSVLRLKPYSSARDEFKGNSDGMVFLDANENPFGSGLNRYPDPKQNKLRTELAALKGVQVDKLLLGNGSDEVLDLIVRVFCEPKEDNMILLPPTYGMYEVVAGVNNIDVIKVNLKSDFQPNVDAILEEVNDFTKIIFLCSPNNPSANTMLNSSVEEILNNFDGIVVIDEAYADFSTGPGWVDQLDNFPNLIVTQTLSKAYGLAGIRLGMCFASEEIINALNRIKPPYNINQLTQDEALKAVGQQNDVLGQIKEILKQRDELTEALNDLSIVKHVWPSEANFLLVEVDKANQRYNELIELGIVVRNRSSLPGCKNCLRFTVGTEEENQKLIQALNQLK